MLHATRIAVTSGTTAEAYGTAVNLTLLSNARKVYAILDLGVDPTMTAEEGHVSIIRVNARSLGLVNETFPGASVETSGPATNNSGQAANITIIPVDWSVKGNEIIAFDIAPSAVSTAGQLHELALLWSDGGPLPQDWLFKFPDIVRIVGAQTDAAAQTTTTRTAMAALTVPAWAKEVVAFKGFVVKNGAITTAEEGIGYFELTSTIPNVTPLDIPSCFGTSAALGTPAGGSGQYSNNVPWVPIHIRGTGREETITPFINLRTAVSTANHVVAAIAYR